MHKNEDRANLTLITSANKVYKLKVGITKNHRSSDPLKIYF